MCPEITKARKRKAPTALLMILSTTYLIRGICLVAEHWQHWEDALPSLITQLANVRPPCRSHYKCLQNLIIYITSWWDCTAYYIYTHFTSSSFIYHASSLIRKVVKPHVFSPAKQYLRSIRLETVEENNTSCVLHIPTATPFLLFHVMCFRLQSMYLP